MFLVTGQMETNLKGVEFFEILEGYRFRLSIPPTLPPPSTSLRHPFGTAIYYILNTYASKDSNNFQLLLCHNILKSLPYHIWRVWVQKGDQSKSLLQKRKTHDGGKEYQMILSFHAVKVQYM